MSFNLFLSLSLSLSLSVSLSVIFSLMHNNVNMSPLYSYQTKKRKICLPLLLPNQKICLLFTLTKPKNMSPL